VRIIDHNNKKDYYDCMQALDEDRQSLYIRKPITLELGKEWPFPHIEHGWGYWHPFRIHINEHIIGFCGKIYPFLLVSKWFTDHPSPTAWRCWDLGGVDQFMKNHLSEAGWQQYLDKDRKFRRTGPHLYKHERRPAFKAFFEECERRRGDWLKLFESRRCPIFVAIRHKHDRSEITYDAMLKPYEFFRTFDPPTAYQEILMFMNNLAVPMKPIPEVDDVTKAEQKGFDKYSFRKDPIRKKKR
jgi:hypothetical protein